MFDLGMAGVPRVVGEVHAAVAAVAAVAGIGDGSDDAERIDLIVVLELF